MLYMICWEAEELMWIVWFYVCTPHTLLCLSAMPLICFLMHSSPFSMLCSNKKQFRSYSHSLLSPNHAHTHIYTYNTQYTHIQIIPLVAFQLIFFAWKNPLECIRNAWDCKQFVYQIGICSTITCFPIRSISRSVTRKYAFIDLRL